VSRACQQPRKKAANTLKYLAKGNLASCRDRAVLI
jgi:hypothetical protein